MSKTDKNTPQHRQTRVAGIPKKALRNTLILSSVAIATTGLSVGAGIFFGTPAGEQPTNPANVAADLGTFTEADADEHASGDLPERDAPDVSRSSDRREETDSRRTAALLGSERDANAITRTEDVSDDDPREIAKALLSDYGWSSDQFGCLDSLWTKESKWQVDAANPTSSAYGIPQALPGSKMASAGDDWATNPATQIKWGLGYIQGRYGSPCSAWGHSQSSGWY